MSSQRSRREQETTVPWSVVFMSAGSIILLTAAIVWLAMGHRPIPERLRPAVAPVIPAEEAADADRPILLPETPLEQPARFNLPSFAAAHEAPTSLYDTVEMAGYPARLVIPRMELDAPVTPIGLERVGDYYQWQTPAGRVVGWHETSALLGQAGNTVLNGHHNIYGQVFRRLIDLEVGDEVIVYDAERAYHYRVTQTLLLPERGEPLEVRLENARWIEASDDQRVTLVSCWPFSDNSHRLIVVARPVPANTPEQATME